MTRIDFYIIDSQDLHVRLSFACKLIAKAFSLGHKLYVHCQDTSMVAALDDLLWQSPADRFIPHDRADQDKDSVIILGCDGPPATHFDVYVNLAHHAPPAFSRFHRLIEVIDQDPKVLDCGRKNYRQYQEKRYPLHRHDLRRSMT